MSPRTKFYLILFFVYAPLFVIPHELGHMAVFKSFGVRVEAFSLGFGPVLYSHKMGGTDYKLSLLPLGGYVQANDQDMKKLAWWKLVLALFAGPLAGLLLFIPLLFLMKWKNRWKWKEVNLAHGFWEMFTFIVLYLSILNLLPIGLYPLLMLDGGMIFLTLWGKIAGQPNHIMLFIYTIFSIYVFHKIIFTPAGINWFRSIYRPYEETMQDKFPDLSLTLDQVKLLRLHGLTIGQVILLQDRLNEHMHALKERNLILKKLQEAENKEA